MRKAAKVHTAPDSKYTDTAPRPNLADSPSATSGAKPAPSSQARSADKAAPV